MSTLLEQATDARQTEAWAEFMRGIGWDIEKVADTYIYIKQLKLFNHSLIKIQHAKGPIPVKEIDNIANKYNALFVLIQPSALRHDESAYKKHGYLQAKMQTAYTANILVNIGGDENEIYRSFSENARRNIKKAQSQLECKIVNLSDNPNSNEFNKFYSLVETVGKIKGFYTPPVSEAKIKANAFKEREFLSLAYLPNTQEPIAGIWFACVDKTVYYIQTGMTKVGYEKLANYILLWEGIKKAKELGADILDFEGIFDERLKSENKKWLGFTSFKERFHGEKIYYPLPKIKIYSLPYKLLYLCTSIFLR